MAEEMRLHVEHLTRQNIAEGMSPEEAHFAALRRFGGAAQFQEECRDQRGWMWLSHFARDLQFSIRGLRKNPGFAAAAVLTLGLGIGFVTTLFTIVNGIAFRGLPFVQSDRIVSLDVPSEQLANFAREQKSCESLALVASTAMNVSGEVVASRQPGALISRNLFDLLRVRPVLGRGFLPADTATGAAKVAIISEGLWRQDFNHDPAIIGREIRINREPHLIVGVMAAPFAFPRNETIWVPAPDDVPMAGAVVVGRLYQGVSLKAAAQEFTLLCARLSPPSSERVQPESVDVSEFSRRSLKGAVRNLLNAILGATFLVLILACANVANLILARAAERGRELALRSALGATRIRLIVQMLTESLVVSVMGAVLGIVFAQVSTTMIWNYIAPEADLTGGLPFWVNFEMDGGVLGFVLVVTLLSSMLTGLVPALRSSRTDLNTTLKDGGSGSLRLSRITRLLVNAQMALSVCLVVAAGLFLTLLIEFNQKTLSYDPTRVLTARVALNEADYPTPLQRTQLFDRLLSTLGTTPGIECAAVCSSESFRAAGRRIEIEGTTYARISTAPSVLSDAVSPSFFDTLQLPLREGRGFESTDTADSLAVALVNTAFATRFGGEGGILGKRFRLAGAAENPWIMVIGVVTDAGSMKAGQHTDGPLYYRPFAQEPASATTLLLRGRGNVSALTETLRRTLAERDRELPLNKIYPVQHILEMERLGINLPGALLVICGLGALALASIGVYGVISFSVKTRTRELGVRLALGATKRDILRLIMGEGVRQISYGLSAGVLLALGVSAILASMFTEFGRSSYDCWIYLTVVALLGGVAAAALYIPARRATRVDPLIALRAE